MTDEVTETFRRDEWEARQIFLKLGEAIHSCQVLELTLVTYAQWIRRGKVGRPMTSDEVETLRERLIGATFGRNYGEVYDLLDKQWNLSQEMKDAVDLRNELAHRWMVDRPNGFDTQESRQAMLSELEAANGQLAHMAGVLAERIEGFMRSVGVNRDEILAELRRLTGS
jgi:hypothetical protein